MRQQDERDLRTALREEAERHRPHREAMLDRINQARVAPAPRPVNRALLLLRPAAAALAVAVVLVLAVAGVRVANRGPELDDAPVAASPAVTTTPARPPTAAPKPSTAVTTTARPSRTTPATTPAGKPSSSAPAPKTDHDGFLASTGQVDKGSNNVWSQGNVVLEATRTITALDVSVEVALTPGVVETGKWSTISPELVALSSERTNKKLIFRFQLRQGATVPAGKYTFAVQFSHTGKRSPADDSYVARVTGGGSGDSDDAKVSGGFAPRQ